MGNASIVALIFVAVCHAAAYAHSGGHPSTPPWQDPSPWPDRIVVTLKDAPQTSFAATWRTDASVSETIAQITEATDDARFDLSAQTVRATTEPLNLEAVEIDGEKYPALWNAGLKDVHYHSAEFHDLQADTTYAYRVRGARGAWSEWFHMRTAPQDAAVKFVYLGDAQNGVLSHWSRLIRAAYATAPDANFILHAGDLVNRASRDYEWAEWFKAASHIHGMLPAIPVAGNHEYAALGLEDKKTDRILSILWRPQFTLPIEEDLPADLHEAAYDLRYSKDIHLFVISTQYTDIKTQAKWLDKAITKSDAKWRIVSMHHPIFSSGRDRDSTERREILLPVLLRHEIDLVLQGHDHTYARGAIGMTPERLGWKDAGGDVSVMFVNSVSGPKQYKFKEDGWDQYSETGVKLARQAENTQFFQVISIDGDTLTYEARTALGALYDDFTMKKEASGQKTITRGSVSTMEDRAFDTTGPYSDANELQ